MPDELSLSSPSRFRSESVLTHASLEEYFHEAVDRAVHNQKVDADPNTLCYIVKLLSRFGRTDRLYGRSRKEGATKAMAVLYLEATQQPDSSVRSRALKGVGDRALFTTGVFSRSFNRKLVDVDYYIALGKSAYRELSGSGSAGVAAMREVFDELGDKFTDFVDVLGEAADTTGNDGDLLRAYELWVKTGSRRAAAQLRRAGIQPSEQAVSRARH